MSDGETASGGEKRKGSLIAYLKTNYSSLIAFIVFIGIITALAIFTVYPSFPGFSRMGLGISGRKALNCFLNGWGFLLFLVLLGLSLYDARQVIKTALIEKKQIDMWILIPAMALISVFIGYTMFETRTFSHAMLWGWGPEDFLIVVRSNFLRSFIPSALMLLVMRPWRFASFGKGKIISFAAGFIFLNYFIAFMAYLNQSYEIE